MSLLNIILILLLSLLPLTYQPMMMILILMLFVTISSYYLVMLKMNWIALIIILSLIGGLLVLYILVSAQTSNESNNLTMNMNKLMFTIPMGMMMGSFNMQKKMELKSSLYNNNWIMIIMMVMMLLYVTYVSSIMMHNPTKSMKSLS